MINQNNNSSSFLIFKELFVNFKRGFFLLFFLVLIEGFLAGLSVLSIIPLSDFLIDPSLEKSSKITLYFNDYLNSINIKPSFIVFGLMFVFINFFKGFFEVLIRYFILKIKYGLLRIIYGDLLENLFKSRWEFFTKINSGSLLNTLGRELPIVGDTLGHITLLLAQSDLIATIPRRQAMLYKDNMDLVSLKVPFQIVPIEIKMIWSPLLHHSKAHQWLRRSLAEFSKTIKDR